MAETAQISPELAFSSAVETLNRQSAEYVVPSWIADGGKYMQRHVHNPNGDSMPFADIIAFKSGAYDPKMPWQPEGKLWIPESNPTKLIEDPFDLDNLRILSKEGVNSFYYKLEELAYNLPSSKSLVGMVGMGGTISMLKNQEGKLSPQLNASELLKLAGGGISDSFDIATLDYPTAIDSSQSEIDYDAELVIALSNIWKRATPVLKEKLTGFLVAHGTDTMSSSAMHASMMLGAEIPFPVAFVCSQKASDTRPFSDVSANVQYAFRSLDILKKSGVNVVGIYAGGTSGGLYSTVGTEKVSDRDVMAFDGKTHEKIIDASNFGVDGAKWSFDKEFKLYKGDEAILCQGSGESEEFKPVILRGYTPLLEVIARKGDDPQGIYNKIVGSDARAVSLITFGSFTNNEKARIAMMQAAEQSGKVVFASNPFPTGSFDHDYQASDDLRRSGVIPTQVPPTALQAKSLLADFLAGRNNEKFVQIMSERNLVGEIPGFFGNGILTNEQWANLGLPKESRKSLYEGKIENPMNPDVWVTISH